MKRVKNEKLFVRFYAPGCMNDGPVDWTPSDLGRQQFIDFQSAGIVPGEPDPYSSVLCAGKRAFDYLCSEHEQMYGIGDWWGLATLIKDWAGELWILRKLLAWKKSLPQEILEATP